MRTLAIAVAAFGAGALVGHLATAGRVESGRAPRAETDSRVPEAVAAEPFAAAAEAPPDQRVPVVPPPAPPTDGPEGDQPLELTTEFARWEGREFARWYAIHRRAWDLPEIDQASLVSYGEVLVVLGRIPRREVLLRVLEALQERDRALEPIYEESAAWRKAHPGPPRDVAAELAFDERLRNEHQRCFDRLHRELAYSDYVFLLTRAEDEVERRPPPGGPLKGGDPYARPVTDARDCHRFRTWYEGYRLELGFPEVDEEFLGSFHQHIVLPLGRLPEPALMRALVETYVPYYQRWREGNDWDPMARDFFARLDKVLAPLDYERMRYSHEWESLCRAHAIPPPTER